MREDSRIFYGRYSLNELGSGKAYGDVWNILSIIELKDSARYKDEHIIVEVRHLPNDVMEKI